jgi:hypothetical protein
MRLVLWACAYVRLRAGERNERKNWCLLCMEKKVAAIWHPDEGRSLQAQGEGSQCARQMQI